MLPNGIYFAPSDTLKAEVGGRLMDIDAAFAPALANDRRMIEGYWRRVINRAGTTPDETIMESIKYVNETFYKADKTYKSLNEAVYTKDDVKTADGYGAFGTVLNAKQFKARLKMNVRKQTKGTPGNHATEKPILVWGAPGIGKTAIVHSAIKELANDPKRPINLNVLEIQLSGYTRENWTLPAIDTGDNALIPTSQSFSDCPKKWLPVYLATSDPEEAARRDAFCATGEYRNDAYAKDGRMYEGGIIFFDEYTRTPPEVQEIIMKLIQDYRFGDNYVLSSKWGTVFAANRAYDDAEDSQNIDDKRFYPKPAVSDRFTHITYVPEKTQWLEWARSVDPITHRANVAPFITEFIEQSDEHVWYATVTNGGFDDILSAATGANTQQMNTIKNGTDEGYQQALTMETLVKVKRMVTPRTWTKLWESMESTLIEIFEYNTEGMTGEEYYQMLIDKSTIDKTDADGVKYKEYYGGILPNVLVDALNSIEEEDWDLVYEDLGGDELLDPTHQYTGKWGRYNKLMAWFRNEMAVQTGDAELKSPLIRDWDEYNSYAKYITDAVINSIWETGEMPAQFKEDDDFVSNNGPAGYAATTYSKWKSKT